MSDYSVFFKSDSEQWQLNWCASFQSWSSFIWKQHFCYFRKSTERFDKLIFCRSSSLLPKKASEPDDEQTNHSPLTLTLTSQCVNVTGLGARQATYVYPPTPSSSLSSEWLWLWLCVCKNVDSCRQMLQFQESQQKMFHISKRVCSQCQTPSIL